MPAKTLIFIPTYNERENAIRMCEEIHKLDLDADLLFVDDQSPDGTGEALEAIKPQFPRLIIHHREGKLGIGSAHRDGITWAYSQGYECLITMDCDFTHCPTDIPVLLEASQEADVVVGSRWICKNSLPGWNIFRRCLTRLGHILTRQLLRIPQDASGAFRGYRLDRLPQPLFSLVQSKGYSFFFESLFILNKNGCTICEIPIILPARTYGESKMITSAAYRGARYLFQLALANLAQPEQFLLDRRTLSFDETLDDPQSWNDYWKKNTGKNGIIYNLIAAFYRQTFIRRNLDRVIHREFSSSAKLLHAGCGSGQVDTHLQETMSLTALDISTEALRLYSRNNPQAMTVQHGNILSLPFPEETFDGYYNLGVVEHFTEEEINLIFKEAHRVLKSDGKMVLFWPHRRATSVFVLNTWHWVLHRLLKMNTLLHPPEISLLRSQKEAQGLLEKSGFDLVSYEFNARDLFIQAVIVAKKNKI